MTLTADQLQQFVRQALEQLEQLSRSDQPPAQVIPQMLQVLTRVTEGRGAVVWMPADAQSQSFQPVGIVGEAASMALDAEHNPLTPVADGINRAWSESAPIAASPNQVEFQDTPLHQSTQFYVPIEAMGGKAGVLHLINSGELDPKSYRQYVGFTRQAAHAIGNYLGKRKGERLQIDTSAYTAILRAVHQMVRITEPDQLMHELANLTRPLIEAQRVAAVGFRRGGRRDVAFSDAIDTNRRAVLVRTVEMLAQHCREREVSLSFTRDQQLHGEDESLRPLLNDLFSLSNAQAVCMTPIQHNERTLGVLIVEYADPEQVGKRSPYQQELAHQAGPILDQAMAWHTRPLRRTSNAISRLRRRPVAAVGKTVAALAVAAAVIFGLFFVPVPLYVHADAQLQPARQAMVSAPMDGRILEVLVESGERVEEGEVLIRLNKSHLQLRMAEIEKAIAQKRVQLDAARSAGRLADVRAAQLAIEKLKIRQERIERKIARSSITSPIDGVVLTRHPQRLEGMSVKQGRELLRIGDLSQFNLVMEVPEQEIALLAHSLAHGDAIEVTFLSRLWPRMEQTTRITDFSAFAPTSTPDRAGTGYAFDVTVPIDLQGVNRKLALANPSGRAKLHAGEGSIAYRYGRDAWQFIKMTLLF